MARKVFQIKIINEEPDEVVVARERFRQHSAHMLRAFRMELLDRLKDALLVLHGLGAFSSNETDEAPAPEGESKGQGEGQPEAGEQGSASQPSNQPDPGDADATSTPAAEGPRPWTAGGDPADHYADASDKGQHDYSKLDALVSVWRWVHAPGGGPVALGALVSGGTSARMTDLGPVFPLDPGLCEASRRLGYDRLFGAALGCEGEAGLDQPPRYPAGQWSKDALDALNARTCRELIDDFHAAAGRATEAEADIVQARNAETLRGWDASRGVFQADTREDWLAVRSLGPLHPTEVTRPPRPGEGALSIKITLADCPALIPLTMPTPASSRT
jgi:hypothetical protein